VTPALVEAARKEGKLCTTAALELNVGERLARTFEAKYPGIAVRVEALRRRADFPSASPRSRRAASMRSTLPTAPTPRTTLTGKAKDWLAPYVPRMLPSTFRRITSIPMDSTQPLAAGSKPSATTAIWSSARTRPESYADLLDPKWQGKIVKAHPGYSGAIMTATFVLARELGWSYFEKLARQKVLQVHRRRTRRKKLLLGERAVMAERQRLQSVAAQGPGPAGRGRLCGPKAHR